MVQWRKSSYSQDDPQSMCIEISTNAIDTALIRDSKNPQGPRLALTRSEFTDLIQAIKADGDTT
ncbi:hypothetical protein GCM10023085_06180 [Actinomadura viridis]|uniref:DUF397 domain-containing protein n=1 Tax=Actinomadura viridis TaxID=58110 RepID=A0A931DPY4_9ACTN|nr:hypothetical protein [Actinomadura viridis]